MTLDTFFKKFDQFADAPGAVTKMRQLVLDLAVKGRLTERNLAKESVASKYSNEPSSEELPANWRLLNFGKYCDIQGGNQPPKSQFSDKPKPGYIRMFQIRDLGEKPVPTYISKESTNRFCFDGEILIGRYGASVGKIFWAQNGAYNVALAKFIFPEDALLPGFAFRVLKSDFFQNEIAGASRSAQAGFNKGDLASIDFPLPPLAEQKRIVAKVDELMALCDRLNDLSAFGASFGGMRLPDLSPRHATPDFGYYPDVELSGKSASGFILQFSSSKLSHHKPIVVGPIVGIFKKLQMVKPFQIEATITADNIPTANQKKLNILIDTGR